MNKVKVNKGNFTVGQFELKNKVITIGRLTSNDISLNDSTASGKHAKITTVMDTSYVQDLGSTNGTFVNGQKVSTHVLHTNDIIKIGEHDLMFVSDYVPQNKVKERDFAKTMLVPPLKVTD